MMQEAAAQIEKIKKDLDKQSGLGEKNTEILKETVGILEQLNRRTDDLIEPTNQISESIENFGGSQNPLFMFIAFIYKHLDDYFSGGLLEEVLDLDFDEDEPF